MGQTTPATIMVAAPNSHHTNDGSCLKCDQIFDRYAGFHAGLRTWFKAFQAKHPEAHISCAGRGEQDQMEAFIKKVSKASWGQSAHNVNCAIDIFCNQQNSDIYPREWFEKTLGPELKIWMSWFGRPGSPYPELPHVEVKGWRNLLKTGQAHLVE